MPRACRVLSCSFVLALCGASLAVSSSEAHAQSLQDCAAPSPANPTKLPIGYGGSSPTPQFAEKKELYGYLASLSLADVDLPTPRPAFVNTVDLYKLPGSATQNTGGNCNPGVLLPPSLPPADAEELERMWILWTQRYYHNESPPFFILNQQGQNFLLSSMEDVTDCKVWTPYMDWDSSVPWIANWAYPGNPYFTNPTYHDALLRRGAAWLALQLIMLDWNHWGGSLVPQPPPSTTQFNHPPLGLASPVAGGAQMNVGAELAGYLGHLAHAYLQVKPVLPSAAQQSVETMLRMFSERLRVWGPHSIMTNLSIRSTYAHYLTYLATGDSNVLGHYQDSIDEFYGNQSGGRYFRAGYFADHLRFDSGYNGWNIRHTMRLLQLDPAQPQVVVDAAHELFDLQAHLTFRDPDLTWYSPNEFNTRSSGGAIARTLETTSRASAGGGIERYLPAMKSLPGLPDGLPYAHAFMRDAHTVGPLANNNWVAGGHLDANSPTFHRDLICQLSDVAGAFTTESRSYPVGLFETYEWPDVLRSRAYESPFLTAETFESPELQDWATRVQAQPELQAFPFEVDGPYTRSFDDEFVYAKFGSSDADTYPYAALIHAGPVSPSDAQVSSTYFLPQGLGGGQISMYWGPFTGAGMRGMRFGFNNPPAIDDWSVWQSWPMHAVSMVSSGGEWTSSSRLVNQMVDVSYFGQSVPYADLTSDVAYSPCSGGPASVSVPAIPSSTSAPAVLVRVCGDIPTVVPRFSLSSPQALNQPMLYSRAIHADESGMFVRTTVEPRVCESLDELWETIPLYDHYWNTVTGYPAAQIWFFDQGGMPTLATPGMPPIAPVSRVHVQRADGAFEIVFDEPQEVGLSATLTKDYASSHNLLIRMAPQQVPGAMCKLASVTYQIRMLTRADGATPGY